MEESKKEKILILVKTYPNRSTKYIETVCTAGIRADGTWVRLFPIPFRLYDGEQQFSKYQWVECTVNKARDPRPESYHVDIDQPIVPEEKIGAQEKWEYRRRAILDRVKVYTRFSELRELVSENEGSLAVFHPTSVKLRCETAKIEEDVSDAPTPEMMQLDLFHENEWRAEFKRVDLVMISNMKSLMPMAKRRHTRFLIGNWGLCFIGKRNVLAQKNVHGILLRTSMVSSS